MPAGKSRATLKTIADETGLSLSTVSLSLRGGAKLKKETRDKVLAAAERLGYVPDRAGVRLRTGQTNVLSLVLDGSAKSIEFTRFLIEGIGQGIADTRYHLNVTPEFGPGGSTGTVDYILKNRLADGVILTYTAPRDARVQALADSGLPFVTHGRTEFYTPHPYHDFDSTGFVKLAVDRMAAHGCKTVMLASQDETTMNHRVIVTAFRERALELGLRAEVWQALPPDAPAQDIRNAGLAFAQAKGRPDGLIADSEIMALPLLSGLRDGGVRLGEDMRIVVKSTSEVMRTIFPDIDSIQEDVAEAGRELARLLVARINGAEPGGLQSLGAPKPLWLK